MVAGRVRSTRNIAMTISDWSMVVVGVDGSPPVQQAAWCVGAFASRGGGPLCTNHRDAVVSHRGLRDAPARSDPPGPWSRPLPPLG